MYLARGDHVHDDEHPLLAAPVIPFDDRILHLAELGQDILLGLGRERNAEHELRCGSSLLVLELVCLHIGLGENDRDDATWSAFAGFLSR